MEPYEVNEEDLSKERSTHQLLKTNMIQRDNRGLERLMRVENEHILDLLVTYHVPDSIDDLDYNQYLIQMKRGPDKSITELAQSATDIAELQGRLNTIKNKMKSKKRPISERAVKKREAKKMKKNKEFKKVLLSAAKSIKIEIQKKNTDDRKQIIKTKVLKPVYNEEGKIVFSKFDFAAHPGAKMKKSHQNPKEILKKMKEIDKKISELNEKGEVEKASEIKNELVWKKAFDKISGKKVKDDPKLLYKVIKKRKVDKTKSKKEWMDRKKKMDAEIKHRQKKRLENINKRIKDKKNLKLKRLSKKGKVVPGF